MVTRPASLPEQVDVGAVTFRLFVTELEDPRGEDRVLGLTDTDRARVRLNEDMPTSQRRTVLWHELGHAAWHVAGLDESPTVKDHEETVLAALAPLQLLILRRNPDLVAYLLADED